jgi:hypothetical protein
VETNPEYWLGYIVGLLTCIVIMKLLGFHR